MDVQGKYELIKHQAATALITASASLLFDVERFEHAQRVARMLATSTLVPEHFRNNIGNCVIALNYADRIKADPFMVLQNMYVVHGRPGIEAKLVIALVNQCGRFEPLEFDETPESCTAVAKEIKSGKVLRGPTIDMKMVKAEKWLDKPGSKWLTMPQVMFRYRSAAFFARTYCPEVLLGMQTKDEIEDMIELKAQKNGTYAPEEVIEDVKERVRGKLESLHAEEQIEPVPDGGPVHRCPHCSFTSASERGLKKHITQSHSEPSQPPPEPEKVDPGPSQEAQGPVVCPNDDQEVDRDYCDTICKDRHGCPAHG